MKDELAEVIEIDSQLPGGFYKRAWQVVNQRNDDYLKYVEELKVREPQQRHQRGQPKAPRSAAFGCRF